MFWTGIMTDLHDIKTKTKKNNQKRRKGEKRQNMKLDSKITQMNTIVSKSKKLLLIDIDSVPMNTSMRNKA